MTHCKQVSIDLDKPAYQQQINQQLGSHPWIHQATVVELHSGKTLQSHAANTPIDICLATQMFSPSVISAAGSPHQFLALGFSKDYLLAFDTGTVSGENAFITASCSTLSKALTVAESVLERHRDTLSTRANFQGYLSESGLIAASDIDSSNRAAAFCQWRGSLAYLSALLAGRIPTDVPPAAALGSLREVYLCQSNHSIHCLRPRFLPNYLIVLVSDNSAPMPQQIAAARVLSDNILRLVIDDILAAGITTDLTLVADTLIATDIITQLRKLDEDDLYGLLEVGGFANYSLGESGEMEDGKLTYRCAECIYYHPNRKWCDLPELPVPVEPDWYCKLWKL